MANPPITRIQNTITKEVKKAFDKIKADFTDMQKIDEAKMADLKRLLEAEHNIEEDLSKLLTTYREQKTLVQKLVDLSEDETKLLVETDNLLKALEEFAMNVSFADVHQEKSIGELNDVVKKIISDVKNILQELTAGKSVGLDLSKIEDAEKVLSTDLTKKLKDEWKAIHNILKEIAKETADDKDMEKVIERWWQEYLNTMHGK